MTNDERKLYYKVLDKMKKHKDKYPLLYNNDKYKFKKKFESNISNNARKGVILFELGNKYYTSIFVDSGYDDIITNLYGVVTSTKEEIDNEFNKLVEYVKNNNITIILQNAKFDKKTYETLIK
jgi:hypothetical protein